MTEYKNNKPVESYDNDLINSFDLEKFLFILQKSVLWCLLFLMVTISSAYLYIRYTKPLYESESVLKLDFQSEAKTLGLANMETIDLSELSGEIEILKSKLFFSQVVDAVGMDVSYFYYGRYLVDERYRNNPFVVSYLIKNPAFYDKPIDLQVEDSNVFSLEYTWGGEELKSTHTFGEDIQTEHFNFRIDKTDQFNFPEVEGKYYFIVNSQDALIRYFQNNVEVRPENFNARTIRIAIADYNKSKARDLITAIDTIYLEYTREAKNKTIEQKIKFLNAQIEETETKLEDFEDYFESFTIENRTVNLQSDLAKTIEQLDYLDSARFNLRMRLSDAEILQKQLEAEESLLVNPSLYNRLPGSLRDRVLEYEKIVNERSVKLSSYNENTYVIQQLDKRMSVIETDLLQSFQDYVENLREQVRRLQSRRNALESNFVELPSMGTEYNKNRRFYALQEEFLLSLRQSKMELEITRAGTVTNFVVLSPASLPSIPIKPQPLMIYGIGIVSGFVVSFGFILFRYLFHNKISGIRELERLISVPVLGSVPEYKAEKLSLTKLVIKPSSKSALSESLRTIRTNMDFINGKNTTKVITITSTISGEGKTFVAVNLGAIIAFSNQKVCVVDLDMRKPKVHSAFGDDVAVDGMSTLLIGKSKFNETVRHSSIENLDYIPAGPNPPNPSELILNEEYDRILARLKEEYDVVILDTPPVGLVTDAVLSMRKSDLQLYVVRADYSKRSFVKSIDGLKNVNRFKNLSVIFNSLKPSGRGGYGYGHGHGYGYGYGYYDETKKS